MLLSHKAWNGAVILEIGSTCQYQFVRPLDVHLHSKWQRHVIEDLRRTFPKIQFIGTTHSLFLIQSLRSGEELILLDGQPPAQVADKPIEEIAAGIMGVPNPQVSVRYEEMTGV